MGEFLAPIIEGFADLDATSLLANVNGLIQANNPNITVFLKQLLIEKRTEADNLMAIAKKIAPASQQIKALETAYDASFVSDTPASLPNLSGTLQGFTLIFFLISFLTLAIVSSIWVNNLTGDTGAAVKTFAMFIGGLILFVALITRFG
jgi:hypothetical protein